MEWYLSLNINQRINAKDCYKLLFNINFGELAFLFSFEERIEIMYNKLKLEGFDV